MITKQENREIVQRIHEEFPQENEISKIRIYFTKLNNITRGCQEVNMQEPEKIYADVVENNGVLRITINHKVAKYLGIQKGDRVMAWIRKITEED